MWYTVSHYWGTFTEAELKNADPESAAFKVACGDYDYAYYVEV